MENIKKELIAHLGSIYINQDWDFVICAYMSLYDEDYDRHYINLVIDSDVEEFLDKLDFEVDPYMKSLNGKIWYADGTWSEYHVDVDRCYGYWERFVCPEIPKECRYIF